MARRLIIIPCMVCEETLGTRLSAYHHLYLQYDLQAAWMSPLPIQPKTDDRYKSFKTEYTCVVPGCSARYQITALCTTQENAPLRPLAEHVQRDACVLRSLGLSLIKVLLTGSDSRVRSESVLKMASGEYSEVLLRTAAEDRRPL